MAIHFARDDLQHIFPRKPTVTGYLTFHKVDFVTASPTLVVAGGADEDSQHHCYTRTVRGVSLAKLDMQARAAAARGVMCVVPGITDVEQPVAEMRFIYLSVFDRGESAGARICAWLHRTPPATLARWVSVHLYRTVGALAERDAFVLHLCVGYPRAHLLRMQSGTLHPLFQFERFIGSQPMFGRVQ